MNTPHPDNRPVTSALRRLLHSERAEGVISTGIVVLIMALIGATMWVTFNSVAEDASEGVKEEVGKIGENDD